MTVPAGQPESLRAQERGSRVRTTTLLSPERGRVLFFMLTFPKDCLKHEFAVWHHSRGTTRACVECGLIHPDDNDPFEGDRAAA